MACTLGDLPCRDPKPVLDFLRRHSLPAAWAGTANRFRLTLGREPGMGCVLMARADLDRLDQAALHDLTFSLQRGDVQGAWTQPLVCTVRNLLILRTEAVTPGLFQDPNECRLVYLADRRHLFRRVPIDAAYNVRRVPSDGSTLAEKYWSTTLNSGALYTWTQIGSALWSAVGTSRLGSYPGLPFSPSGDADNFTFWQTSAWDALNDFLDRLGCAIRWNPFTDAFTIVRLGVTDSAWDAALTRWEDYRIWEGDHDEDGHRRARVPQYVRVLFPKNVVEPGTSPWYAVDVTDASGYGSGVFETGTYQMVTDDLQAIYDETATLTNSSALSTRAAERAEDWFRQLHRAWVKDERVYGLPLSDVGLLPGARTRAITWEDLGEGWDWRRSGHGGGLVTRLERWPDDELPIWEPKLLDPLVVEEATGDSFSLINLLQFEDADFALTQSKTGQVLVAAGGGHSCAGDCTDSLSCIAVWRKYTIPYTEFATNPLTVLTLPEGSIVEGVIVDVTSAFDAGRTLNVGVDSSATAFLAGVAVSATGATSSNEFYLTGSAEGVILTMSGAVTQGELVFYIKASVPLDCGEGIPEGCWPCAGTTPTELTLELTSSDPNLSCIDGETVTLTEIGECVYYGEAILCNGVTSNFTLTGLGMVICYDDSVDCNNCHIDSIVFTTNCAGNSMTATSANTAVCGGGTPWSEFGGEEFELEITWV